MSIAKPILDWISEFGIKSLINAPCAGRDCDIFKSHGVDEVISVNIIKQSCPYHVTADLCEWRPDKTYDAAYINCIFCGNLGGKGDHRMLAENYVSWPVRYLIVYDTSISPFDWTAIFETGGWKRIRLMKEDNSQFDGGPSWGTRCEVWERA